MIWRSGSGWLLFCLGVCKRGHASWFLDVLFACFARYHFVCFWSGGRCDEIVCSHLAIPNVAWRAGHCFWWALKKQARTLMRFGDIMWQMPMKEKHYAKSSRIKSSCCLGFMKRPAMKRPAMKRPAAAESKAYGQTMEVTHDGEPLSLLEFRDKVRGWASGTLGNKIVTLAFTSNKRPGAHGFYDRFYCKSCQEDCLQIASKLSCMAWTSLTFLLQTSSQPTTICSRMMMSFQGLHLTMKTWPRLEDLE